MTDLREWKSDINEKKICGGSGGNKRKDGGSDVNGEEKRLRHIFSSMMVEMKNKGDKTTESNKQEQTIFKTFLFNSNLTSHR